MSRKGFINLPILAGILTLIAVISIGGYFWVNKKTQETPNPVPNVIVEPEPQPVIETLPVTPTPPKPASPPSVTLLYPNGGEILYSGNTYSIKWKSTLKTGEISFYLRPNSDKNCYKFIGKSPVSAGIYSWVVDPYYFKYVCGNGNAESSGDFQIYADLDDRGTIWDYSDSSFMISGIEISFPPHGDHFGVPAIQSITPNIGSSGSQVTAKGLRFDSANNVVRFGDAIMTDVPAESESSLTFVVPSLPPDAYAVKIGNAYHSGYSAVTFYLDVSPPEITLPKGAENWKAGGNYLITWQAAGYDGDISLYFVPKSNLKNLCFIGKTLATANRLELPLQKSIACNGMGSTGPGLNNAKYLTAGEYFVYALMDIADYKDAIFSHGAIRLTGEFKVSE